MKGKMTKKRRPGPTTVKQNPITNAPPPAIYHTVTQRRVQKGGVITLSADLPRGASMKVVKLTETTFIVGSSNDEVASIISSLPKKSSSPFALIAERLRGQSNHIVTERARPAFGGVAVLADVSDERALRGAQLQRSRRTR